MSFPPVEVDELRIAFEDVTSGEDLHWFFDQWYLSAGHPKLSPSLPTMPTVVLR